MTRLRSAAVSALLLPLALAGCGDDDDPQPRMSPSSATSSDSPTSSPSADATEEPTLPPEAEGNDEAAAEAFIRYYYDVVNYAQRTGDVTTLKSHSLPSCQACTDGANFLRDMYANGGEQVGGDYEVQEVQVFQADTSPGVRIFETTVATSTAAYSLQESSSASPDEFGPGQQEAKVRLTWDKSGFSVAALEQS